MIYLKVIIVLIIIDIILGIYNGILKKEITSLKSFIGMFKKAAIIGVCVGVQYAETYLHEPILDSVIYFFIITEIISILENLKKLGIPIPGFMNDIKGKEDDKKKKDE